MSRVPVSIVVPARDEGARIGRFVAAHAWADQILVVDGGSADGTAELARAAGAEVIEVAGVSVGAQRNAGAARARHQWVLAMDADEWASPELPGELAALVGATSAPPYRAWWIRRRNIVFGREHRYGEWGPEWVLRLFHRDVRYTETWAHETLDHGGAAGRLRGTILHEPYRTLDQLVAKLNRHGRWAGEDMLARGRRAGWSDLMLRPLWRAFRTYTLQGGALMGLDGVVSSIFGGWGTFLKYAHLRALEAERRPGK